MLKISGTPTLQAANRRKNKMLSDILHTFIPLFVAVDAFGVLPIFVSLTEGLDTKEKNRVVIQSIWTASVVAVVFILLGKLIFRFLGLTIASQVLHAVKLLQEFCSDMHCQL